MAVIIKRFDMSSCSLQLLSDHGGDEDHIIIGERFDADPRYLADFMYVVETMDKYDLGSGTVHEAKVDGKPVFVYIIAHA